MNTLLERSILIPELFAEEYCHYMKFDEETSKDYIHSIRERFTQHPSVSTICVSGRRLSNGDGTFIIELIRICRPKDMIGMMQNAN